DNNIDSGSELSIKVEKDENYYRMKQGKPRKTKFRSIIDIYKLMKFSFISQGNNRLSSSKDEYNGSRLNTLEIKKSELHIEDKRGKDQEGTYEEILHNKHKDINSEFASIGEDNLANNLNRTMDNNVDNTNDEKDEEFHVSKGISRKEVYGPIITICKEVENEIFEEPNGINIINYQNDSIKEEQSGQQQEEESINSLVDTCEVAENEIFKEPNGSNIKNDQKSSFEEELPRQQQQDIDGESKVNKVTCEAILNDNIINCGSKLLTRDEKDENYRVTQGLPRSIKFRSIDNLYKCTDRLSPVEAEFN
ncbi:hypothetical protein KY289_009609, partial [Solanum tuberosum]